MKVGIIGGGAAGIMSALFACKGKNEVTVIEHNDKLLKKILSTGNGKCNFTNTRMEAANFHNNYKVIEFTDRFGRFDTIKFFNSIGVVEYIRDGYVYPASEQAASIRNALLMELDRYDTDILLNTYVKDIKLSENGFFVDACDSQKKISKLYFDKLIVATGLKAAPKLGSDGSFLPVLDKLNIKYRPPLPALCGIKLDDKLFFKMTSGVRAKGEISVYCDNKKIAGDFGELQFADSGISGIPTFQVSRYVSKLLYEIGNGLINSKLWLGILEAAKISPEIKIKKIDKKSFDRLVLLCKKLDFKVKASGDFDKAQVCTGGIPLKDVDENLMYKSIKNLYFAGEILDVDGICGGYNLQWAWTSGYIAGNGL